MDFLNRLPRPNGGWASPLALLRMTEDEYAALLRERGYGERFIAKELAQLREARARHDLPGPVAKNEKPSEGNDRIVRLVTKRQERQQGSTKEE